MSKLLETEKLKKKNVSPQSQKKRMKTNSEEKKIIKYQKNQKLPKVQKNCCTQYFWESRIIVKTNICEQKIYSKGLAIRKFMPLVVVIKAHSVLRNFFIL